MYKKSVFQKIGWFIVFSLLTLSLATAALSIHETEAAQMQTNWNKMPLHFIENQGQADDQIAYYLQGNDKTLFFAPQGLTFALINSLGTQPSSPLTTGRVLPSQKTRIEAGSENSSRWIVKLDFLNANPTPPLGQEPSQAVISYFKGSPEKWRTGVPTFSKIFYPDLWEGIDLTYSGTMDRLKYEFVVHPGADPGQIRLAYRGASVRLNSDGQLDVSTPVGGFQDDAPVAYQEVGGQKVPVEAAYSLEEIGEYGFRLGAYDPAIPLVIDPAVIVFCGYVGAPGHDTNIGMALDNAGNIYLVGKTDSGVMTLPANVGLDNAYISSDYDAVVVKVKADGTGFVFASVIGGDEEDSGNAIAVDPSGSAYIVGNTFSKEDTFPVTVGPDLDYNGAGGDAFVAKLKADGTGLVYAGFIGGSAWDGANGIAVNSAGNAFVTGKTVSSEASFPVTVGPDLLHNGGNDVFVAKVKTNGTGLDYCGYIGGSSSEEGAAIALDNAGDAYLTGYTWSTEATFPVKIGPDLTYNPGGTDYDAFVAKVKANGTGLVYCGYIGGNEDDWAHGIAVSPAGNAYVTGWTESTQETFPVTVGPDLTHNNGWDVFVAKVKVDGSALEYCGYIGGRSEDAAWDIALDAAGNAYVTGITVSDQLSFPVTKGPDLTQNGYPDGFVAMVKANGTKLVYCGYIGGNYEDWGVGIGIDSTSNAIVTGNTNSTEATFPVIGGPDLTYNGNQDGFVTKVSYSASGTLYLPFITQ